MGVSIALFGLRLKNRENGRYINIIEHKLSMYNETVVEELYKKLKEDEQQRRTIELGKPELGIYSRYIIEKTEMIDEKSFFGKLSYGENIETKVSILKENEAEELAPKDVAGYAFHFYFAPLILNTKKGKEYYIILLIQMTDGSGVKTTIIDNVYKKIIQKVLNSNPSEKYELEIKSFNYGNFYEVYENSIANTVTIYKDLERDNIILSKFSDILDQETFEAKQIIKIKKIKKKMKNISEKFYSMNLEELKISKVLTEIKINGKNKSIRMLNKNEKLEANQTRIDVTEEYKKCNNNFDEIKELFISEYEDIKEWSGGYER